MDEFPLLIGGCLVPGDAKAPVINPANEAAVALCDRASVAQLDAAVRAAADAFPVWSATPLEERAAALAAAADIIQANAAEIGALLTAEQGKPLAVAVQEAATLAMAFRFFAASRLEEKVLEESAIRRVVKRRRPLGVVAAIVPWNFPLSLLGFKLPPALVAGNTVVVKPAATTPLSALRIGALIKDVFPAGVLNVIADQDDLGPHLTRHPDVAKISFTGSTATGVKVMENAAQGLKRITLELGGNDAALVLPDVDIDDVAAKIFEQSFRNSGQVCIAMKRVYVHDAIYDAFCAAIAKLADAAVVGDGAETGTEIGPLQNKAQYERVLKLLEVARVDGTIIAGGEAPEGPGYFVRPTVVRDIEDGSLLVDTEQFGPILPLIRFSDIDDALRRINRSIYGLGGSIWTADEVAGAKLARQIEAGTVWINKHAELLPTIPFGGAKMSGLGVELGSEGLEEFTQVQVINGPPTGEVHS